MSYEGGPDSLDGGVALFFRLEGCGVSKKKKEAACYARGVMSEARGKDKIRLRLSSGSRCHWR